DLKPRSLTARRCTARWLMPRRGASGDGSGQDVWTCRPQPRLVAWARAARPHGAAPEPPSRRALSWHQPSLRGYRAARMALLRVVVGVTGERRVFVPLEELEDPLGLLAVRFLFLEPDQAKLGVLGPPVCHPGRMPEERPTRWVRALLRRARRRPSPG